jgi:hypothetical protein
MFRGPVDYPAGVSGYGRVRAWPALRCNHYESSYLCAKVRPPGRPIRRSPILAEPILAEPILADQLSKTRDRAADTA